MERSWFNFILFIFNIQIYKLTTKKDVSFYS